MPFPSELSYASFLNYSPRGTSDLSKASRAIRDAIKRDQNLRLNIEGKLTEVNGIKYIVSRLPAEIEKFPFLKDYLGPTISLIPVPRSAPLSEKDALWPTRRICEELVAVGLGSEVLPLLVRKMVVQKSATAEQGKRPGPEEHYESTGIDNEVPTLVERPFTMVDDFVTRGSSFVGMFRRLIEAYPNRNITCFSLMATESDGEISKLVAPTQGRITRYPSGKLWRDSGRTQQPNLL